MSSRKYKVSLEENMVEHEQTSQSHRKRESSGNTSDEGHGKKGEKMDTNNHSDSSSMKVAVLSADDDKFLSYEELLALEDAIVEEIKLGGECKPQFKFILFRAGMLLLHCCNTQTANWLKDKASQLSKWEGVGIKACVGDEIPSLNLVTIYLPKSKGKENEKLLAMLDCQNEGLNTRQWKIVNSKEEDSGGKTLTLAVDDQSLQSMKDSCYSLYYRFGKVQVRAKRVEN